MAKARNILVTLATLVVFGAIFANVASAASWTVLGGDPLFPGGIQSANQSGRNKFVHDMLSSRGVVAQKRAGLDARQRQAFKSDLVHGQFSECTLHVGDHFKAMSFGVGAILVDRNVTFGDTAYQSHGAPAFCVTVRVGNTITQVKVPFKCENFSVVSERKCHPHHRPKCKCHKPKHHKPKPPPSGSVCSGNTVTNGSSCGPCSTVVVGSGNIVTSNPECKTEEPKKPCGCTSTPEEPEKPCGCQPPPKPEPEVEVKPEKSQEFELNETSKEAPLCATVRPGAGSTITAVYLEAEYGNVETKRSYPASGEMYCNETYKAPSTLHTVRCTEPGLDPGAEWCDVVTWTVEACRGEKTITVHATKQVALKEETPFEG